MPALGKEGQSPLQLLEVLKIFFTADLNLMLCSILNLSQAFISVQSQSSQAELRSKSAQSRPALAGQWEGGTAP